MTNRREVVTAGLAAALLARTSAAGLAGGGAFAGDAAARSFVADERRAQALAAARAAAARGASIRPLGGDVTRLYESLDLAWRAAPFALAGLTTPNALFLIERLALDRGMRTAYRGIHRRAADGRYEHELLGSRALIHHVDVRTEAWGAALGHALAVWRGDAPPGAAIVAPLAAPGAAPPGGDADGAPLVSWLLVPRPGPGGRD